MNQRKTRKVLEVDYGPLMNGKPYDAVRYFLENGPFLIKQARAMQRKEAVSHRDVYVGACALMTDPGRHLMRAYVGFNYSPVKGVRKHCAEARAIGRGFSDGFSDRDAVVVASDNDPDVIGSINGVITPTLYVCKDLCAPLLQPQSVVLTVGAKQEQDLYEVHTGAVMQQLPYGLDQPKQKRNQRTSQPAFETIAIEDPGFFKWAGSIAVYDEIMNGVTADSYAELRMLRADAAVEALQSLAA